MLSFFSRRNRGTRIKQQDIVDRYNFEFQKMSNGHNPNNMIDISTYPGNDVRDDTIGVVNGTIAELTFQNLDFVDVGTITTGWRAAAVWDVATWGADWNATNGVAVTVRVVPGHPTKHGGGPMISYLNTEFEQGIGCWPVPLISWIEFGWHGQDYDDFTYIDATFVTYSEIWPSGEVGYVTVFGKGNKTWVTITTSRVKNLRVCGPIDVPAALQSSTLHGVTLDAGWADAAKNPARDSAVDFVSIRPYNGPVAAEYPPATITRGAITKSTGALSVAIPNSSQVGDILVLCVAGNVTPTVNSDWTISNSATITGHSQRIYTHTVTGNESWFGLSNQTTPVTHTAGACVANIIRMRTFNTRIPFFNSQAATTSAGTGHNTAAATNYGMHRTSLIFVSCPANITYTFPAGWDVVQSGAGGGEAVTLAVGIVADWNTPGGALALNQTTGAGRPMEVPAQALTLSSASISISNHLLINPNPLVAPV